jgi:hypothetical protein
MQKGTHLICVASVPQLRVQEQERTSAKFWNSAPTHTANHKSHITAYNSSAPGLD